MFSKAVSSETPTSKPTPTPVRRAAAAFRMCKGCGRPTPHQEPACTHCGKRHYHASTANLREQTERHFVREFFDRATPVAYGLFAFNLLLYVLMARHSHGFFVENLLRGASETTLYAFGAANQMSLLAGQWFRLLTSAFLHLSGLHIISTSFALAIVGPQVERLYGSARFLMIYVLVGFGGTLGSVIGHALNHRPADLAVSASGATFGLFGVLAVFGFKYRNELPASFRQSFAVAVLPAIGVSLFIGFTVPFIDNAVTIGGLLAGIALTFLIPYLAPGQKRYSRLNLGLLTACALLVFYCFGRAYVTQGRVSPPLQSANFTGVAADR